MRKILTIASREFNAAVRTRGFLVGLLTMPVFMFGSVAVQAVLAKQGDLTVKRIGLIDRSPGQSLAATIEAAVEVRNKSQIFDPKTGKQNAPVYQIERIEPSSNDPAAIRAQRLALSDRVRNNTLAGFFDIGKDVLAPPPGAIPPLDSLGEPVRTPPDEVSLRYQAGSSLSRDVPRWVSMTLNSAVQQRRITSAGVTVKVIQDALRPVPAVTRALTRIDSKTGEITDGQSEGRAITLLIPAFLGIMMFMMILVGSTPLMQVVFEEKTMRIAEVLLGSVRPFELMAGKLIGMVGVSLVSVGVYMGGAYWAAYRYDYLHYAPASLLAWFMLFQTLGVVMYGSLFIAIGSACNDVKDTQSMMMPVMLLLMIPLFALFPIIENPTGPIATVLSYFPFSTPLVMLIRLSIPPTVPLWQPIAGALGMILMSIACIYAGGRIFRVGLLLQGKTPSFLDLARWVIRG